MSIIAEFKKAWNFTVRPEISFEKEKGIDGYWPILRWYLVLCIILAVLTPVVNWLHIPCDIVHAGTNAQMGAFVQAPGLEAATGISRYLWVAVLTYLGNVLKFPVIGVIFHVFAKLLRGKGSMLDSFKVGIYASAPVLLLGWIPYFGLISGLWVAYIYVVAFKHLHETALGPTIALVNLMIGIQLVWAFLFGWAGSSVPW